MKAFWLFCIAVILTFQTIVFFNFSKEYIKHLKLIQTQQNSLTLLMAPHYPAYDQTKQNQGDKNVQKSKN